MTKYTPTTEEVRLAHAESVTFHQMEEPELTEANSMFDRWLDEVKADVWDEGKAAGHSIAMRRMSDEPQAPTTHNPYRKEEA